MSYCELTMLLFYAVIESTTSNIEEDIMFNRIAILIVLLFLFIGVSYVSAEEISLYCKGLNSNNEFILKIDPTTEYIFLDQASARSRGFMPRKEITNELYRVDFLKDGFVSYIITLNRITGLYVSNQYWPTSIEAKCEKATDIRPKF
jgi:hypothetical protein